MIKVKMLARHTGENGKMEPGLTYLLPRSYAQELIDHGLAVLVVPPLAPPVNVTLKPTKTQTMATVLRELRGKNQEPEAEIPINDSAPEELVAETKPPVEETPEEEPGIAKRKKGK